MRVIEIMAGHDCFHDVTGDLPDFFLRERVFILVPICNFSLQILLAEFHEDTISVVLRIIRFDPVVIDSDNVRTDENLSLSVLFHAHILNDVQLSKIQCVFWKGHCLQGVYRLIHPKIRIPLYLQ
jgi:hypothetical protein